MSDERIVDLPLIVAGRKRYADSRSEALTFTADSGLRARVPVLTKDDLAEIEEARQTAGAQLARMTVLDVTTYLSQAGRVWGDRASSGRQLLSEYGAAFSELPQAMIDRDADVFSALMLHPHFTYDALASEFGHERFLDEWLPTQMCYRRAFPRGLVLHYLVGNIPLASMYSLFRGIMTRNMNLAKWASRDPITPLGMADALLSVDPDHPIARSLSMAYWPHNADIGDLALDMADAVCVWGGEEAVRAVKGKVRIGVPIAEYGPRWSAAVIDLTRCDPEEAAYRLAEDVAYYDQEACLSAQRAFVRGDAQDLARRMRKHFEAFSAVFPLGTSSKDALAHRAMSLAEARYLDWPTDAGRDWATVVVEDPDEVHGHPLGRTVYLHQVDDLAEIAQHFTPRTQTIGAYPWNIAFEYGDEWARRGVDRLCELGAVRAPRSGWSHDGSFGLHALVRIVAVERPLAEHSQYWLGGDHDEWLRNHFRLDLAYAQEGGADGGEAR